MIGSGTWVMSGVGSVLPGLNGQSCQNLASILDVVRHGLCCLSEYDYPGLPLKVAGQVQGWDPYQHLRVPSKWLDRWSRAGMMATGAVQNALDDAGLAPGDIDGDRTVLIGSSLQFSSPEASRYYATLEKEGAAAVGMDYWMSGTPVSVLFSITSGLGLNVQTMGIAGACNSSLRALQVAQYMLDMGEIDTAIMVGLDTTVDPVFVAGAVYQGKLGFRASSLTDDPLMIRPHDVAQSGNAVGEGALAMILRRGDNTDSDRPRFRCGFQTSRSSDPEGLGADPKAITADVLRLLEQAEIGLGDLAFFNDYAEGNPFIEQHVCRMYAQLRATADYDDPILVTNQEAAFGHVGGFGGLLKLLSSTAMLADGRVGPSINCRTPHPDLPVTPVPYGGMPVSAPNALITSSGAGGDSTAVLVQHMSGRF